MTEASVTRPPGTWRHLATATAAFARLHAVDDVSYPLALGLRVGVLVVPLFAFYFVAELVDQPGAQDPQVGSDYFTFAAVGVAIIAVMGTAVVGFGQRLQLMQVQGALESLLIQPVPWTFLPLAMNLWPGVLGLVTCGGVLGLAALLGAEFTLAGVPALLAVLALGIPASMAVGIVSASVLILAKRSDPVVRLYEAAASVLAGALFPIELLPWWLEWISYALPHTYLISGTRQALMASPPDAGLSLGASLIGLAAFATVGVALGMWLFARSLRYARRVGLLGSY